VSVVDPRLLAALQRQWQSRDAALGRGARRVGWKLGMGRRERIGEHIAVGHLTTATVVDLAGLCDAMSDCDGELHVDAELCVEFGSDLDPRADATAVCAAVWQCWPALELVDLAPRVGEPESIVAGNVFHRAVAFGQMTIPLFCAENVTVSINGREQDQAQWPEDVAERIVCAAGILSAMNERFRAGDRVITGAIVQVPMAAGDVVRADFGEHATLDCRTSA